MVREALQLQRDSGTRLSVEILQPQNIPFETRVPGLYHVALMLNLWDKNANNYLLDSTFSRFHTIPECDRHTHTDKQTDGQTHDDALPTKYNHQATSFV